MKLWEKLTNSNLLTVAEGLDEFVKKAESRQKKKFARVAERYYRSEHDIKNVRILYFDDHDNLVEDKYAANTHIPHSFFTEQVDQKTQYLLANGIEVTAEDEQLQALLDDYINEDFQLFIDEMVEGASIKGVEYAYARTNADDRLSFQTSDFFTNGHRF